MAIDININNQNKHWVLVILDKVKNVILWVWRNIVKILKTIGRFIKRIWKILVGLAALVVIIVIAAMGYDYYKNEYIPQKLLDEAVSDIESKFNSKNDSIKYECSISILTINYDWGYTDVPNSRIDERISGYREDAFKFIESKAFEGNPHYQFWLGQFYQWADEKFYCHSTDLNKAAYWWNEAASQGYILAYNNLGLAYLRGLGVDEDKRKGIEYLKRGAEAGEDYAQWNYGNLFRDGVRTKIGSHKEIRSTKEYYHGSKDNVISEYFDSGSMNIVTRYYETVDDYETLIPKDIEQAKYWWKKSAAQGNEGAKEELQKIY